jgi:hypothetical protein
MPLLPDWANEYAVEVPYTDTTVGIYVERDGHDAVVNFRDSSVTVRMETTYRPVPGEPVTLKWFGKQLRVTGPTRARASTGKITALGYPRMTVDVEDETYKLGYDVKLDDLAVNDKVAIVWSGGGYISAKVTATNDDQAATPRLTTDQKPFDYVFLAKDSGSYWDGKWRSRDVLAAKGGGWFYGPAIHHNIRDDAHIESVQIWLPLRTVDKKGALSKIGRHTQDTRPKGDLSLSDLAVRKPRSGWVTLPDEWAEGWRDSKGGVGISGGGDNVYKGIQANRQSGKLRIKGRQ